MAEDDLVFPRTSCLASGRFGWSVAISGPIAIIGAYWDDDKGDRSGSAYLFDVTTGQQLHKLLPDDGATFDDFGTSVAISGNTVIVGTPNDDDNGFNSGSAYLFDTTTGKQIAKLLPASGASSEFFGWSIAMSGTTAIVGAFYDDYNGEMSGSAYLFDVSKVNNPIEIAKLLPDDGATDERFGSSVMIYDDTAIVGAFQDDDNGNLSGSAYLFDTFWCQWDLNNDGITGTNDLLVLLGLWGSDPDGPPDFDRNGTVGTSDLLILFANWGPCP